MTPILSNSSLLLLHSSYNLIKQSQSLKISLVATSKLKVCSAQNVTYNAGIMLGAFAIPSCSNYAGVIGSSDYNYRQTISSQMDCMCNLFICSLHFLYLVAVVALILKIVF